MMHGHEKLGLVAEEIPYFRRKHCGAFPPKTMPLFYHCRSVGSATLFLII